MAHRSKDFRVVFQHDSQSKPTRIAFESPDTARRWARDAFEHGAHTARAERISDGVVIYDGPGEIDLTIDQWYATTGLIRHD